MNETIATNQPLPRPLVWLVDSERAPLAACRQTVEPWAETVYYQDPANLDWSNPPDAILFSAEIAGGSAGQPFQNLLAMAEPIPLIAVARLRSLAQAVAFFRAGAVDYLALPLDRDDAKERTEIAIEHAAALALQGVMVELEPVDNSDPGEISLNLVPSQTQTESDRLLDIREQSPDEEVDILAELPPDKSPTPNDADELPEDEPVAVDGLLIPSLWDELPCGLLVFDSNANLAFANQPGLDLFGLPTIAHLEDALDNNRKSFNAYSANNKPLPDNQWPHILAVKTRTARSALISIEKQDKRRAWLRIDCLPHIHEGVISRVLLTVVNLTGDLPPLHIQEKNEVPTNKPTTSTGKKTKHRKKAKK